MFVKIMTFNLRKNTELDGDNAWPYRMKAAVQMVKRHDADMIGIQEGLHGMLEDLARLLPEYAWIGEGREGGTKGEYAAILYKKSKWNAGAMGHFSLSEHPEQLGVKSWNASHTRMCTWVTLKSQTGDEFATFNTHLDHLSEEAQHKGMELIRERMQTFRNRTALPVVLTGDFNVYPDHAVVTGLEQEGYRNAYSVLRQENRDVGATFHDFQGSESEEKEPIDYIFVSPEWEIRHVTIDREQYEGKYPSDHYPVIAELIRLR